MTVKIDYPQKEKPHKLVFQLNKKKTIYSRKIVRRDVSFQKQYTKKAPCPKYGTVPNIRSHQSRVLSMISKLLEYYVIFHGYKKARAASLNRFNQLIHGRTI